MKKDSAYSKKKSSKQENRTAKEFGGRVTPASGALSGAKGDVRTPEYLIENKYTDADSYKLELKTWKKIENEAIRDSIRIPMMQIDIQDLQLVVMEYNDFLCSYANISFVFDYYPTPHKSTTLKKKELSYLANYNNFVYVVGFGSKQLAIMEKEQFFLLDKN